MPPRITPIQSDRVLGLFPHRRITGRAAFDETALVPRSFAPLDMRSDYAAADAHLELLVGRSIQRFRPSLVAIGVPGPSDEEMRLGRWAEKVVRHFGLVCVVVDVSFAAAHLLHSTPTDGYDRLGQLIAREVPDLADRVLSENTISEYNLRRRRSFAWKAALAALAASGTPGLERSIIRNASPI